MTISRSQAATFLEAQFSNLRIETQGALATDAETGYGPDIDQALRRLGVSESGLSAASATDDERDAFYALCEYYALTRFRRKLATRVDIGAYAVEGNRDAIFANLDTLIMQAESAIESLGYSAAGTTANEGWIALDFLEPA